MGLVTLVGLVTIALSVYMITYSHKLYEWLEPLLGIVRAQARLPRGGSRTVGDRAGLRLHHLRPRSLRLRDRREADRPRLQGARRRFRPRGAAALAGSKGHPGVFGDATDPEFAGHLPLNQAHAVISAVPRVAGPLTDADAQLALLHGLRSAQYGGEVVLAVDS
jgi:hypothetical protein